MPIDRHTDSHPPVSRRSRALAASALLVALLATAACSGSDSGTKDRGAVSDGKAAAPAATGAGGESATRSTDGSSSAPNADSTVAVHVIRTATLSVEVKDVPDAVEAARGAAEDAGGLVADESTRRVDDTHDTSRLVLRVPQAGYEEVLRGLAGSGKLLSRTSNAKDVTGEVVDVKSRIATQRASVARVRDLMDKAEELSDVVTLEGELSSRQADLESLLAQQASLKDRTTLATITLELSEPAAKSEESDDEDSGFVNALSGGWGAFVTTLRWIGMAIGAVAPFLATAAVVVLLWRLLRRRLPPRPRTAPRQATGTAEATEPTEAPQPR
ncbi:DUF4349 domain-containing protein [Streptomyces sp. NBC_01012]|uniref:DUF4349 domain-containing protein n=1 Tax=Streptomyces sp. NBC_01012 TaxID=2903717 RepID=UPI003867FEB2|nr:DUF4349 domain-containing protein [Streptomyces sp. NBC_01012]